jgi:diguanylate cyclase (GGDEF)-like protein/PAS domain S-box-containing protein
LARRLSSPGIIVTLFVLAMSACVLGMVVWKASDARTTALAQSQADVRNLAHSLSEHAAHTVEAVDVAITDIVAFLAQYMPEHERMDRHLRQVAARLPQIDDLVVYGTTGQMIYASRTAFPPHTIADREYFIFHRDYADAGLSISGPLLSRASGRPVMALTKRLQTANGQFSGVVVAAITTDFFAEFYKPLQLGQHGGIALLRTDSRIMIQWPSMQFGNDLSKTRLFQEMLPKSPSGYYKAASPIDGIVKYFGYQRLANYPLVVTVSQSEATVLAEWHSELRSNLIVAAVLLCSVILLAVLLSAQLRFRANVEKELREREAHYRLLADNIADVIVVLDQARNYRFVSQSVTGMLGWSPEQLIGSSAFDRMYPDDIAGVRLAEAQLSGTVASRTIVFRVFRADGSLAWIEANFKRAPSGYGDDDETDIVAVLRDVTHRKAMEDQLNALNSRLAELATTDSLTGLANRRTLDVFLRREFASARRLSVLLLDIDHFKSFNDSLGHQAGDECLKSVAAVLADATAGTASLSARYGGEEFALILPDVTEEAALKIADEVRLKVRALGIVNGACDRGYVTVSIGIAAKSLGTQSEAALLGEADHALYAAKRQGRNRCVCASSLADTASLVPEDCFGASS